MPEIVENWQRKIFDELIIYLHQISPRAALEVKPHCEEHLAQADNIDKRYFYHILLMKHTWLNEKAR